MSWGGEVSGARYVVSHDVTKAQIGQVRVDYDTPEGVWPEYHVHGNWLFFGTHTRTVTKVVGLNYQSAYNMCHANGATQSTYKVSQKGSPIAPAEVLFESYSKTTTMQRVDASGQYHVTITEASTVTDGNEITVNG